MCVLGCTNNKKKTINVKIYKSKVHKKNRCAQWSGMVGRVLANSFLVTGPGACLYYIYNNLIANSSNFVWLLLLNFLSMCHDTERKQTLCFLLQEVLFYLYRVGQCCSSSFLNQTKAKKWTFKSVSYLLPSTQTHKHTHTPKPFHGKFDLFFFPLSLSLTCTSLLRL